MRLMGGSLAVESAPGAGSTFSGDLASVPESLHQKAQGGAI
jgi:signal transduction histidine kinase